MTGKNERNKPSVRERTGGFKLVAEGLARELKKQAGLAGNAMKEGALAPFKTTKDIKKGFKLIGQGKLRELRGKAAQRLVANLQAQGMISDKTYEEMSNRIEKRTEVGKVKPSDFSKANGDFIKTLLSAMTRGK